MPPRRVRMAAKPQDVSTLTISTHCRMMGSVKRDGNRTKLRLVERQPTFDVTLRALQFSCAKRNRPFMVERLQNERRLGVLIDEIPSVFYSFAGGGQLAADIEDCEQPDQKRETLLQSGSGLSEFLRAKIGALGFKRGPSFRRHQYGAEGQLKPKFLAVPLDGFRLRQQHCKRVAIVLFGLSVCSSLDGSFSR